MSNRIYIHMTPAEREAAYWALRDALAADYNLHIGPRASRNGSRYVARLREAGHTQRAEAEEKRLEEAQADYDAGVNRKTCLAILAGRYDDAIKAGREPAWSSHPDQQRSLEAATAARRAELLL